MLRIMLLLALVPFLPACSVLRVLDFGGDDKKSFEFRFGWEHGIEQSTAPPRQTDECGVYHPETPEVDALLSFPDIHAGLNVLASLKPRITPTVGLELAEFKVPYLRWFNVQIQGGTDLVDIYVGKRLLAVYEVTIGPWYGYDFTENRGTFGIGATLIRF